MALLVVSLTGGCGLGDRADQAKRIHDTKARAVARGTAVGVLTLTVTPERKGPATAEEGIAALTGAGGATGPAEMAGNVELQLAEHLAKIALPSGAAATVVVEGAAPDAAPAAPASSETVFRGGTILVKRTNLRPTERRTWAKLDLRDLPDNEPRLPKDQLEGATAARTALNSLHPEHVLDLTGGALAGSVRVVGREDVGGVPTTRYKANVSVDRAIEQLDLGEEELEARRLVLRLLLGSNVDVEPGEFWIDDEGLLRRSRITFTQRINRTESNELEIVLELSQYGTEVAIPSPTEDETVEVERYGRLMRASLPADA